MSEPLLQLTGVTKRFGGFKALDRVDLCIAAGERLGLIGPNGSGKSTLVNCISGVLRNDEGTIRFQGADVDGCPPHRRVRLGLARSFQIPKPFASMSVLDNIRVPLQFAARHRHASSRSSAVDEAMQVLDQVGLAGKAHAMSGGLTQVDMRKLELARAIAARPSLLIADEAMAGLSASETDDILGLLLGLRGQGVAVIMIEHIMRAVMRFSDRIVVLVAGRKIADGDPESVVEDVEVVTAYLGQ